LASVWLVILVIGFVQAGNGLQTDLLGVRADMEAFPPLVIGLIMACYYVGYSTSPLVSRSIIGRLGHVMTISAAALIAGVVIVLHGLIVTAPAWALLRLISGLSLSILYVAVESWIHERVDNRVRGRIFSLYVVMQLVAMTGSQALLNLGSPREVGIFAVAGILFALGAVPAFAARHDAPHKAPPEPFDIVKLFRVSPLGVLVTALSGVSWSIVFTFGPVYAGKAGFDLAGVSLFMGLAMAGGAVAQFPFGWLADAIGRRPTIVAMSTGALGASLFGLWASRHGFAMLDASSVLLGALIFPLYAISVAETNDKIAPQQRVPAAAGLVLLFGLGSILGPLLCGGAMSAAGPQGFFAVLAAVTLATVAVAAKAR
jgi:MFS family permease